MGRILAMIAVLTATAPALAQTQSLVVPPGSTVVIGPRSQPAPRPHLGPARPQQRQRLEMVSPQGDTLSGPAAWAAAGMAAAALAAVLFAGGSGGGGGGGGGSGGGSATGSAAATVGR
jgi:hypothetical protein